jgi:AcrR family transcriptional regulator
MRTMAAIQRVAFRLFAEQGYDATTVEQVAAAADVSSATFFRYFRSKADLISTDEFDPLMMERLASRPAGEDAITAILETMRELFPLIEAEDREALLERSRLLESSNQLQAQLWQALQANIDTLATALAARSGQDPAALEVRATAAAVVAALFEMVREWAAGDGRDDLLTLAERALAPLRPG